MDQINIWSNAPENHREGRAVSGEFFLGFDGGGATGWFSGVLKPTHFFFYEGLLIDLFCIWKTYIFCAGELVF